MLDPNQTLSSLRETGNFRGGIESDKKKVMDYIGPQNPPTVYVNTQGSIQKVISPAKSKNQPDRENQIRRSVPDTDYIKTASNFNPGVRGVQIQNQKRHILEIAPLNHDKIQNSNRDVNTQLDIQQNIVAGDSMIGLQEARRDNLRT